MADALARLTESGATGVRIIRTRPPWSGQPTGGERVVRQRCGGAEAELVVAAEGYLRERD
ncbi:MAG TPA: hypothetical protein VLK32_08725 [Bacillota bacterium]|nr:hypothetical protein [Bacillota bacterium]